MLFTTNNNGETFGKSVINIIFFAYWKQETKHRLKKEKTFLICPPAMTLVVVVK